MRYFVRIQSPDIGWHYLYEGNAGDKAEQIRRAAADLLYFAKGSVKLHFRTSEMSGQVDFVLGQVRSFEADQLEEISEKV